jgi:hypothetical protein
MHENGWHSSFGIVRDGLSVAGGSRSVHVTMRSRRMYFGLATGLPGASMFILPRAAIIVRRCEVRVGLG